MGGSVHAKYLVEAVIEADEDIHVENEIVHSHLKTRGGLHMPNGRLVGGEIMALGGIYLGEAGNPGHSPTRMIAGEDYRLRAERTAKTQEIARLESGLQEVQQTIRSIVSKENPLTLSQRKMLAELHYKKSAIQKTIENLKQEILDLEANALSRARGEVAVKGKLFPEAIITLEGASLTMTKELSGPIRLIPLNGKIHTQFNKR